MTHVQFYVNANAPSTGWPKGSWSLYQISADEIARRIGFDDRGNVNRRDSLPGYVGTFDDPVRMAERMRELANR